MLSYRSQSCRLAVIQLLVMFMTVRHAFWTKAFALLGLVLLGLLLHHVVEEHHEGHQADCPTFLLATGLFLFSAVVHGSPFLIYLGTPRQSATTLPSRTVAFSRGRSPPQPVTL